MTDWTRWLGPAASAASAAEPIRTFQLTDPVVDTERVQVDGDAWRIEAGEQPFLARLLHRQGQSIRMFEIPEPGRDGCLLIYRAQMRTEDVRGRAYLEMWCRFPNRREYFSKGLGFDQVVTGTAGWTACETPFVLQPAERPDLVRLNVVMEG